MVLNSTKHIRYNKIENPCPICGSHSKGCSTPNDADVIYCRGGAVSSNTHYFSKLDRNNVFGIWVNKEASNRHRSQYKNSPDYRKAYDDRTRQNKIKAEVFLAAKPTLEVFDVRLSALLASLNLTDTHKQSLLTRGLSEEVIQAQGYKSISNYTLHTLDLEGIPGFSKEDDGKYKYFSGDGYICPLRNAEGLLTGFQLATDDQSKQKYKWTSTVDFKTKKPIANSKLRNGETPLGISKANNPDLIGFCEGVLKHVVTSHRLGVTMIGTVSNQQSSSPEQLKQLLSNYPINKFTAVIYPDAGAVANIGVTSLEKRNVAFLKEQGYTIQVADWGHWFDKDAGDCDEIDPATHIEYRDLNFYYSAISAKKYPECVNNEAVTSANLVGGKVNFAGVNQNEGDLYEAFLNSGSKYALSISPTGSGKSYYAYNCDKPADAVVHYTALSQKSVDIDRAKIIDRLASRNSDEDLEKEGEVLGKFMTSNNCHWTEKHHKARAIGLTSESVCGGCPLLQKCVKGFGEGYGFKHQYGQALGAHELRVNYANISEDQVSGLKGLKIAFLDEISMAPLINSKTINNTDIAAKKITLKYFTESHPAEYRQAINVLRLLASVSQELIDNENEHFSYGIARLKEEFSGIDLVTLLPFAELVSNQQRDLNKEASQGTSDYEKKVTETQQVWFHDFVRAIAVLDDSTCQIAKTVRSKGGELTYSTTLKISTRNRELKKKIEAYDKVVFQDATINPAKIIDFLDIEPEELVVLQTAKADYSNVTVKQYFCNANKSITDEQHNIARCVMESIFADHADTRKGVISYKAYENTKRAIDYSVVDNNVLAHFSDARGSNKLSGTETLVIEGDPRMNIGAALDEYNVLKKLAVIKRDDDFKIYLKDLDRAEVMQEIGRLRHNRRPDELLTVCYISKKLPDLPLIGNMQIIPAHECGARLRGREAVLSQIQSAYFTLTSVGLKVNTSNVGEALGVSRTTISRACQAIEGGFKGVIKLIETWLAELLDPDFEDDYDGDDSASGLVIEANGGVEITNDSLQGLKAITNVVPAWEVPIKQAVNKHPDFQKLVRDVEFIKEHNADMLEFLQEPGRQLEEGEITNVIRDLKDLLEVEYGITQRYEIHDNGVKTGIKSATSERVAFDVTRLERLKEVLSRMTERTKSRIRAFFFSLDYSDLFI